MTNSNQTKALRRLTEKQQKFVLAFLETGGQNETEAARLAGYSQTNPNGCSVEANRLMRNPDVIAAIKEEAQRRVNGGVLLGASVLIEIASDKFHKDRLKAAQSLLDRGGMMVVGKTEHSLIIEDKRSEQELISFITAQAKLNGLDPKTLLGFDPGNAIDAEAVEIIEEEDQTVIHSVDTYEEPDL